jgi:transposase
LEKIKGRFFKKVISLARPEDNAHLLLEASLLFPATNQNTSSNRSAASYIRFNKIPRRLVKVALLTNRQGIPLYYQAYEDDEPVTKYFDQMVDNLLSKVSALGASYQDLTILIGTGINSLPLREKIAGKPGVHYIAAMPPDTFPELLMTPVSKYRVLPCQHNRRLQAEGEAHHGILYHGPITSEPGQALILFDPAMFKKMRREFRDKLQKLRQDLVIWQRELRQQPVEIFTQEIQNRFATRCKDLQLEADVLILNCGRENGKSFVQSRLNRRYCETLLRKMGKTVIQTDRLDWQPEDICDLAVDRGLLGDSPNRPQTLFQSALTPQYHWTDSKIPIHVFVCMVALTYLCFLNNRLNQAGLLLNAKEAVEEMRSLKTAIFLLSEDAKPQRLFEEPNDLHAQIVKALGYELNEGRITPQEM